MVRGVSWNSRWASCAGWLRRVLATTCDSSPRYPGEPFALPHARLSKRIDRNAPHFGGVYIAQISAELIETRALAMLVRVGPRPEYRASSGCLGGRRFLDAPRFSSKTTIQRDSVRVLGLWRLSVMLRALSGTWCSRGWTVGGLLQFSANSFFPIPIIPQS